MFTGIGLGIPLAQVNAPFHPSQVGTVLSWVRGDDTSNTLDTGVIYDDLNDAGSLGGTWDAATNKQPVAATIGGKTAPIFRGTRHATTSLPKSSWNFLHDGSTDYTFIIRLYVYENASDGRLFTTNPYTSAPGIVIRNNSGTWIFGAGNGASFFTATSASPASVGWNTITVRYVASSTTYHFSVNGETEVPVVAASPSASDATYTATLGTFPGGAASAQSAIAEMIIVDASATPTQLTALRNFVEGRWSATPDYHELQESGIDIIGGWDANVGVTEASGVSAIRDIYGYNNDATQATNKPALVTDDPDFDGADTIDFDGVNDFLTSANYTGGAVSQPYVLVCCGTWDTSANNFIFGLTLTGAYGLRRFSGNPAIAADGGNVAMSVAEPVAGTNFVMWGEFNGASSKATFETEGAATTDTGLNPGTATTSRAVLGAYGGGANFWDGKGARWLVISGIPDAAAKERILDVFRTRAEVNAP